MVRLEMMAAGDPPFETDHVPVDYAVLGFATRWVTDPADLEAAAREIFAHDGPALLDMVTTSDALEMPSHVTEEDAKGFALALGKMVLTGGVGEVVNIARLNVRNIPV
jgi:pyruvate dehydrogenase (quinone)